MNVSRQPVAELMIQRQTALVHPAGMQAPAVVSNQGGAGSDLQTWVDRSPMSSKSFIFGGLALAAGGFAAAIFLPTFGLFGVAAVSTAITLGSGLAFLGLRRKKKELDLADAPPPVQTGPQTSPSVLAERARRVQQALAGGEATFEALMAQLKWTESALVETLLVMKDQGIIEEDLNLDSGEWVYRVQMGNSTGVASSMMLEDRRAHTEGVPRP